jgi:inner membrane protein
LGVFTHGLLDTCTSYGTYLLWPFSSERLTFSNMAIIDPLFTLPMLLLVILATVWKKPKMALTSVMFGLAYIGMSQYNQSLVEAKVREVAEMRGHKIERIFFNPTLGNNIVWRTVYESEGRYYVNGVRSIPFKTMQFFEGVDVAKVDPQTVYPELGTNTQQRKDIVRFDHFSMGFLYEYQPNILADLRYGIGVNGSEPLWGIYVNPETPDAHIKRFRNMDNRQQALADLKQLVFNGKAQPIQTNEMPL